MPEEKLFPAKSKKTKKTFQDNHLDVTKAPVLLKRLTNILQLHKGSMEDSDKLIDKSTVAYKVHLMTNYLKTPIS